MKVYRLTDSFYDIEEVIYTTEPGDILIENLEYNNTGDICKAGGVVEYADIKVLNKGYQPKPVTDTVCNVYKVMLADCYTRGFILVAAKSLEEANKLCSQVPKYFEDKRNINAAFGGYYFENLKIIEGLIYHGEPTIIEEFHTIEDYLSSINLSIIMLSNKDKQIRRYLKKICSSTNKSTTNASRYYKIVYNEALEINIRFSDHFNGDKADVDIVKTSSNIYVIKLKIGISFSCYEDYVLPYLKSILLIYPELHSSYNTVLDTRRKAINLVLERDKVIAQLKSTISKKDTEYELVDDVYEENKRLKEKIKNQTMELDKQVQFANKRNKKITSLENKLKQIKHLCN